MEKTIYKTDKNSQEFRIINMEGKIPNIHNLVKKSDFTKSAPKIKNMCQVYMYSTNQHSFEQRDNKISTGRLTDAMKDINRNKIINIGRNVLTGDNGYRNKLIYPLLYQVFKVFL